MEGHADFGGPGGPFGQDSLLQLPYHRLNDRLRMALFGELIGVGE